MGSGGVAIAALFIVICLEVPFSDGLGGEGDKKSRRKAGLLSMVLIPKYGLQGLNEV